MFSQLTVQRREVGVSSGACNPHLLKTPPRETADRERATAPRGRTQSRERHVYRHVRRSSSGGRETPYAWGRPPPCDGPAVIKEGASLWCCHAHRASPCPRVPRLRGRDWQRPRLGGPVRGRPRQLVL